MNRRTIRDFDAWQQGTGAITDVSAPEMVWRIEGHSLTIDSVWREVADTALAFVKRFT